MGPLRGGVTLLLSTTSPVFGEVCDKERPSWDPSDGPMTAFGEVYDFLFSPVGLAFLAITVGAIAFRSRVLSILGFTVSALFALGVNAYHRFPDPTGISDFAIQEGCIGPPHLLIAFLIAICAVNLWNAVVRKRNSKKGA